MGYFLWTKVNFEKVVVEKVPSENKEITILLDIIKADDLFVITIIFELIIVLTK